MNSGPLAKFRASGSGRVWRWALIFGATVAAYFPATRAGFIWNDSDYVTKPALRSLDGLRRIWFQVGATEQYYPLLHSAFWIEHRLWGDAAAGYHWVNILLHATSACLLWLLVQKVTQASSPAVSRPAGGTPVLAPRDWPFLAALIFALHPVYAESVAWISEQKNTLSTVFYLLAALAYFRFAEERSNFRNFEQEGRGGREDRKDSSEVERPVPGRFSTPPELTTESVLGTVRSTNLSYGSNPPRSPRPPCSKNPKIGVWYFLATALFLAALLSKTVTATLPGALLVVLWWQKGRLSWKRDVLPLIPWFLLGAASGLFSAWVERTYVGAEGADFALNFVQRGLVAGHAVWFYLGKLVWPADLIFIYPRWVVSGSQPALFLYPLAVLALVAALWLPRRRSRAPLAALLFFLGSLFPVCGFFNLYAFIYSFVADHWQYLPSIGIVVLAAGAWGWLAAAGGPWCAPLRIAAVAVLALLGLLTFRQSGMYRDMETFYRRTLERNPACWMAENNLGDLYEQEGRWEQAGVHYQRALEIKPTAKTYYNLGTLLRKQHRPEEAIVQFEEALRLAPNFAAAHNNLGGTLGEVGRSAEAIVELEQALELDPNSPAIRSNLGIALVREGKYDEALAQFQAALRLDPESAGVYTNLGVVLRREERYPEAIAALQRALQLDPGLPMAHVNLGIALAMESRLDEAVGEFREAVRLDPGYAEAHNDLGNALSHLGQIDEARAEFQEALRLNPNLTDAQTNLDQLPPSNSQ